MLSHEANRYADCPATAGVLWFAEKLKTFPIDAGTREWDFAVRQSCTSDGCRSEGRAGDTAPQH